MKNSIVFSSTCMNLPRMNWLENVKKFLLGSISISFIPNFKICLTMTKTMVTEKTFYLYHANYYPIICFVSILFVCADLGRMYSLVSKIRDGLGELKTLLERHIFSQGDAAIKKCGEAALNVGSYDVAVLKNHSKSKLTR